MAASHSLTAIGTDPDALEAFYREHVEAVQRFVARRVSDPHLAADLTADVFLEAIESAAGYRSDLGPPRAWLFGGAAPSIVEPPVVARPGRHHRGHGHRAAGAARHRAGAGVRRDRGQ